MATIYGRIAKVQLAAAPVGGTCRWLAVGEEHGVDDPDHHAETQTQRCPGERLKRPDDDERVGLDELLLELPAFDEGLVLRRLVAPELLQGHASGEDHEVHRKLVRAQVGPRPVLPRFQGRDDHTANTIIAAYLPTRTGKILRRPTGLDHYRAKKSGKRIRKKRKMVLVSKGEAKKIKKIWKYSHG